MLPLFVAARAPRHRRRRPEARGVRAPRDVGRVPPDLPPSAPRAAPIPPPAPRSSLRRPPTVASESSSCLMPSGNEMREASADRLIGCGRRAPVPATGPNGRCVFAGHLRGIGRLEDRASPGERPRRRRRDVVGYRRSVSPPSSLLGSRGGVESESACPPARPTLGCCAEAVGADGASATALQPPPHLLTTLPAPAGGGRCEAPDGQRLAGAYFRDRLARPASGGGSGPSAAPLSSPPATGGGAESDEVTLERGRLDAGERGAPPHGRDAAGDPRPAPSSPSSAPASADECSRHAMARSLYWRVSPQAARRRRRCPCPSHARSNHEPAAGRGGALEQPRAGILDSRSTSLRRHQAHRVTLDRLAVGI